jgi:hypothetical protein
MPLVDNHIPVAGNDYAGVAREHGYGVVNQVQRGFDPLLHRPYFDKYDRPCVTVNTGEYTVEKGERLPIKRSRLVRDVINDMGIINPVLLTANATALRKEDWIEMDRAVLTAARQRLRAWADLRAANSYGGFDGMSRMTLEYEAMSDPGEAIVDMDGITEGRTDNPLFKLRSLPLPITHSDFWFSERRLKVSRNSTPLDTTMAEAAARRVAEKIEKTTIGEETGVTYGTESSGYGAHDGDSKVWGYTNFTYRNTKTNFTVPTGSNASTTFSEVLEALNDLYDDRFYGPFMVYHSTDWTPYMNGVFSSSGGNHPGETLRSMILKIPDVVDVRRLDFLDDTYTLLFVQMTADVARAVNGMDITTVQWPSLGGLRQNYKVMAIQVPQLRADYNQRCGILHGTTA